MLSKKKKILQRATVVVDARIVLYSSFLFRCIQLTAPPLQVQV